MGVEAPLLLLVGCEGCEGNDDCPLSACVYRCSLTRFVHYAGQKSLSRRICTGLGNMPRCAAGIRSLVPGPAQLRYGAVNGPDCTILIAGMAVELLGERDRDFGIAPERGLALNVLIIDVVPMAKRHAVAV